MNQAMKAPFAVAALAVLAGCAAAAPQSAERQPTHRWIAEGDVSRAKYNFDHKACADEATLDVNAARKSAPEFVAYERCMADKGYSLASY